MPSGSRLPSLTITLRSEPSGFAENTCPLLALRKNKRAVVVFATGLLIVDLAVLTAISCFRSFISLVFGKNRLNRKPQFTSIPLHEGAETGYGLTEYQVLYLEGAFVGVERFRIGKEAGNVVICGDAITAQKLPRPGDRLAALGGGECLGKRGMRIRQLAFGLQLAHANQEALRCCNVGNHLGEEVLHHLEGSDGLSELKAFLTILERVLVGAHGASSRFPANHEARHLQNAGGIAERLILLQTVRFRYSAVFHRDQAVLDYFEGDFVLDLLHFEARRGLVFHDERFDLVVGYVASPDNGNVAPRSVADPFLLTIDDPGVSIPLRSRQHSAGGS